MHISVIIPTYNRCELLRGALLSIFSKTLLAAEVAVINDGFTGSTNAMIREEFPKPTYYRQENCDICSA